MLAFWLFPLLQDVTFFSSSKQDWKIPTNPVALLTEKRTCYNLKKKKEEDLANEQLLLAAAIYVAVL